MKNFLQKILLKTAARKKTARNSQKGFAASFVAFFVLLFIIVVAAGLSFAVLLQQKAVQNSVLSLQSYYAAEAGIEDILVRLKKSMPWQPNSVLAVGGSTATTEVSTVSGDVYLITSEGNAANRIRKIQTVYEVTAQSVSFYYGAQVGLGGMLIENNGTVKGNVFSDGSIIAENLGVITDTAIVAGAGRKISGGTIQGNAYVDICENAAVLGMLRAVTNNGCTYGSFVPLAAPPTPVPLPISEEAIQGWKQDAESGGTIIGDYILDGENTAVLGPKKITGNLIVDGNAQLTLDGAVWVVGNVTVQNLAKVLLSENYATRSGVLLSDGVITLQNNSVSQGSGLPGSYLLYLSTAALNPAIVVKNNAVVDILYANNGWIVVENNAQLRELTGYGIHVKNNASVTYEVGLSDSLFSSGPGGGWEATSWKEI